jgi:uncharacterized membrane protein SirB2
LTYLALKFVHVAMVITTYALFVLRGAWMLAGSSLLAQRWVRITPHVVDTMLLASALLLAATLGQYPFVDGWLTAKVTGLLAYIVLGTIALKRGRSRRVRVTAWITAQLVFFYIVAVAVTRMPMPFMP